jgi:sialate O-acetylesterase
LQEVPNTGIVVTSDISTIEDIHPKDKKSVGFRLANLALANIYKTNTNLVNGPIFKQIKIEKNKVIVSFDYADGLHFSQNKSDQFEIAGTEGVFYEAKAVIKNNTIIVHSDKVKEPTKVRFAWKNTAQSQLFNKADLPASSFTTD